MRRGNLQKSRTNPIYLAALIAEFKCLISGAILHDYPDPRKVNSSIQIINLLIDHIQHLWESGAKIAKARYSVLAVQTFRRRFYKKLKGSWDSIESWQSKEPSRQRTPIPSKVMSAMFVQSEFLALDESEGRQALDWLGLAVGLLVCFFGLLRFMGRWRNLCTLDHYVQEVSATLVLINLPSEVSGHIESLLREGRFLRRAPTAPWNSFASRAAFSYGLVVPGDFGTWLLDRNFEAGE